ncbi:hypothetical protein L345_17244, partial [Ophiophagus hannah]
MVAEGFPEENSKRKYFPLEVEQLLPSEVVGAFDKSSQRGKPGDEIVVQCKRRRPLFLVPLGRRRSGGCRGPRGDIFPEPVSASSSAWSTSPKGPKRSERRSLQPRLTSPFQLSLPSASACKTAGEKDIGLGSLCRSPYCAIVCLALLLGWSVKCLF